MPSFHESFISQGPRHLHFQYRGIPLGLSDHYIAVCDPIVPVVSCRGFTGQSLKAVRKNGFFRWVILTAQSAASPRTKECN